MGAVGTASVRLDGRLQSAHLSTGKLRQEFQTLVRQLTGTSPVVTQLAGVLGEFALGGGVTLGVLAGVGAIISVYNKLTESARKAKAETDKLIKGLVDQARAAYEATVAGQQLIQLQAELELQAAKRASPVGPKSFITSLLRGAPTIDPADAEAASKRIADAQTAVERAVANVGKAWEEANRPAKEAVTTTGALTFRFNELRDAAERVNEELAKSNRDWWKGYIERTGDAIEVTGRLEDQLIALLAKGTPLENLPGFGTAAGKPIEIDIPALVKPTVDVAKKINDAAAQHAQMLKDAIWGSAAAGANAIVSALNVGGGGKGSNLGGSLGATAGFAAGFAFGGPVGGAIGSTIGNVFGSLVGGLFDHKKAVNSNTQALRENTAALLLNAPSGYKVAAGRYDATRVLRQLGDANRRWVAGGGVSPLTAGTL